MNSNGNPILIELAEQLPPSSKIYKLIMTSKNYSVIISQAKEDFFCFGDMESEFKDGLTGIHLSLIHI